MMWTIYGGIGPGDTVLVNAIGGGVGLMCTQLAVRAGARVIGTTGTPGKEARALAFGASRVVVTSQEDFERAVLDFTDGKGVDLAIDSYGATMLDRTFGVVKMLGHIISIGEGRGAAVQEHSRAHPAALADLHPPASRPYRPDVGRMAGRRRTMCWRPWPRAGSSPDRGCVSPGRGGGHAPPPRRSGRRRQAFAEGGRLTRTSDPARRPRNASCCRCC